MKKLKNKDFSLTEVMVVMGISALAVGSFAVVINIFTNQRNNLVLEQVSEDLASEIKETQSQILAIKSLDNNFPPKAAILRLNIGGTNMTKRYVFDAPSPPSLDCSGLLNGQNFNISPRAEINDIRINVTEASTGTSTTSVYLVFVSPTGKFYAFNNNITFSVGANAMCLPSIGSTPLSDKIDIILTNSSITHTVRIDAKSGGISTFRQ